MIVLPPSPKESMSQLACALSAQLYLALGIMSRKWAAGYLSREGEQGRSSTAGKGAGKPLLDPSNHLFGQEYSILH